MIILITIFNVILFLTSIGLILLSEHQHKKTKEAALLIEQVLNRHSKNEQSNDDEPTLPFIRIEVEQSREVKEIAPGVWSAGPSQSIFAPSVVKQRIDVSSSNSKLKVVELEIDEEAKTNRDLKGVKIGKYSI